MVPMAHQSYATARRPQTRRRRRNTQTPTPSPIVALHRRPAKDLETRSWWVERAEGRSQGNGLTIASDVLRHIGSNGGPQTGSGMWNMGWGRPLRPGRVVVGLRVIRSKLHTQVSEKQAAGIRHREREPLPKHDVAAGSPGCPATPRDLAFPTAGPRAQHNLGIRSTGLHPPGRLGSSRKEPAVQRQRSVPSRR